MILTHIKSTVKLRTIFEGANDNFKLVEITLGMTLWTNSKYKYFELVHNVKQILLWP